MVQHLHMQGAKVLQWGTTNAESEGPIAEYPQMSFAIDRALIKYKGQSTELLMMVNSDRVT